MFMFPTAGFSQGLKLQCYEQGNTWKGEPAPDVVGITILVRPEISFIQKVQRHIEPLEVAGTYELDGKVVVGWKLVSYDENAIEGLAPRKSIKISRRSGKMVVHHDLLARNPQIYNCEKYDSKKLF